MSGKSSWRSRAGVLVAVLTSSLAALVLGAPAAHAATLSVCRPWNTNRACTVVTSAPAGGVQVLDRTVNRVVTWQNGTSVALETWYTDIGHQCGINGDDIVWRVNWRKPDGTGGVAYIGDYYLDTGSRANWSNFTVDGVPLSQHNGGRGRGSCDRFAVV
jgi:hypothetical protein